MALSNGLGDITAYHVLNANSHSAGTNNGTGFDALGNDQVLFVINTGSGAATSTLTVKIQESDDNSTWTDITGATTGTLDRDAADLLQSYVGVVNMNSRKRYLRSVSTMVNGAVNHSVTAVGMPYYTEDATTAVFSV